MTKGIRGLAVGVSIASILASAFYGADVRAVEVSDTDGETKGVVSTDIRPQDDYYGYINAGVLREADIDPKYGYGSFFLYRSWNHTCLKYNAAPARASPISPSSRL